MVQRRRKETVRLARRIAAIIAVTSQDGVRKMVVGLTPLTCYWQWLERVRLTLAEPGSERLR